MSAPANPERGEAALPLGGASHRLRPSFQALVAAEAELGPLFGLVERAAAGELRLAELAGLFWHCLEPGHRLHRSEFETQLAETGLAALTAPLRILLRQILAGA